MAAPRTAPTPPITAPDDERFRDDFDEQDREGLDENGNPLFECAAWWTGTEWHCPLAGSEECDWECDR